MSNPTQTVNAAPVPAPRAGTGTSATKWLGVAASVMLAWTLVFGLVLSPPDRVLGESVRLLYVHVPTVFVAYCSFIVTACCSAFYLFGRRHSLGFDRFAGASAEIGTLFMGLSLLTGSIWGRLTWGVFWAWDARLTTTAMMFITYIGYLAVRGLGGTHTARARRSAIVGLLAVVEIPLVHWSVQLWRSLHQSQTFDPVEGSSIQGTMLFSWFVSMVAFALLYVWLLLHRSRVSALSDMVDDERLDKLVSQRQAEEMPTNTDGTRR